MEITDNEIFLEATDILKSLFGENASFRQGQYEAIEATMTKSRTLIVQRTGWGKSLVYFSCAKMLIKQGRGATLVISPLLVLMENQLEQARALNLRCEALNSETKERHNEIIDGLKGNMLDLVLITPETLYSEKIQRELKNINIGLFVIDEAHCISDWGHDFRMEYGKLKEIIADLPTNIPILAATATANDRVIADLEKQLGNDVYVSRGPLTRESLCIQVLKMPSKVERYAWILENINKLEGSGIIYCLTQRDCDYLADFLNKNGISAMPYYSSETRNEENKLAEEKFKNNEIKTIVSTIKLGMGYDKGDISFVIHYQMPSNIVSYYQQIGRAGRNIEKAHAFLMSGKEDMDIINYFINTSFPSKDEADKIIDLIETNSGIKLYQIENALNMRSGRLKKALDFLQNDGFVKKDGPYYYLTQKPYCYDKKRYDGITLTRKQEAQQILSLTNTQECYSRLIVNSLDDHTATNCGKCSNCLKRELLSQDVSLKSKELASNYIDAQKLYFEPRKRWAYSDVTPLSAIKYVNEKGICLARYGEVGYGELVKAGKEKGEYSPQLLGKTVELLRELVLKEQIKHIAYIPSLRNDAIKDFTASLAQRLKLELIEPFEKNEASPQKEMENSAYQCANAYKAYSVKEDAFIPERLLLVDDEVCSKWTMTVCGYKIMEAGCKEVYPFALALNISSEA